MFCDSVKPAYFITYVACILLWGIIHASVTGTLRGGVNMKLQLPYTECLFVEGRRDSHALLIGKIYRPRSADPNLLGCLIYHDRPSIVRA